MTKTQRIYKVRVERGNRADSYYYQVMASSGTEAGDKAIKEARKDSGYKNSWRVIYLEEQSGLVVA